MSQVDIYFQEAWPVAIRVYFFRGQYFEPNVAATDAGSVSNHNFEEIKKLHKLIFAKNT